MRELIKKRSRKGGLPPGTLVHIGEPKSGPIRLRLITYSESEVRETEGAVAPAPAPAPTAAITWLDVGGVHQLERIEAIGRAYGLHPLLLEDVVNTDQRPKLDDYDSHLYVVLKMLYRSPGGTSAGAELHAEQVSLVLGPDFVLSFQEDGADVFEPVRERVRSGKGRTRSRGADYLFYSLIDTIVDSYFPVLEVLGERIAALEEALLAEPETKTLHEIHRLKRELLFLRRSIWPVREVINACERGESPLIQPATRVYFRDVYDHTIQILDTIETFRDMAAGMLEISLSNASNRMTAVMKILTVIATIFMPLTFIAGVYGMNFEHMPELRWRWGYPFALALMLLVGGGMLVAFKRRRWF